MTSQIEIPPHAGKNGNGNGGTAGAAAAASIEGGSYDVIRKRLLEQASELAAKAEALNEKRKKVFGGPSSR